MNERIEGLIKQAQVNDLAIDTNGDLYDVKRLDPEKFAELIVQECVTICNDTNDASYLNGVIAGRKIKQHFGVEE